VQDGLSLWNGTTAAPTWAAPVAGAGDNPVTTPGSPGVKYMDAWGGPDNYRVYVPGQGMMNSGQHDVVVRVIPLISNVQGAFVPALSVETLRVGMDAGMRIEDGPLGLLTLRIGDVTTPMHDDGTVYVRMSHYDDMPKLGAAEILGGRSIRTASATRWCSWSMSGQGILDYKTTPLGEFVPGGAARADDREPLQRGEPRSPGRCCTSRRSLVLAGLTLTWFIPRLPALQGINLAAMLVLVLVLIGIVRFAALPHAVRLLVAGDRQLAVFTTTVIGTLSSGAPAPSARPGRAHGGRGGRRHAHPDGPAARPSRAQHGSPLRHRRAPGAGAHGRRRLLRLLHARRRPRRVPGRGRVGQGLPAALSWRR
jgi:hypothetical protein